MIQELREYLGVMPFDYAQSKQFNVYDWARRQVASKYISVTETVPTPKYFLDGSIVEPSDLDYYIAICEKEVNEIIKKSRR